MIIALLALAFAMIVGGLLSAFFGWDIVLIERGWVMVIAGSFSAGCGALLLGITAAVSKLTRIHSELARLHIAIGESAREETPSSSTGLSAAALAGGLLDGGMLGDGAPKDEDERQPDLPLFAGVTPEPAVEAEKAREAYEPPKIPESFPPRTAAERPKSRDEEEPEVKVPDFLLAERRDEVSVEPTAPQPETSLFVNEPRLYEREEEPLSASSRDEVSEPELEPEPASVPVEPEPEEGAAPQEPAPVEEPVREEKAAETPRSQGTVVGTYNSGDNTYVMFSDGSIEAQTPAGVFQFKSLDELKAFIASGGEGGGSI